MAEFEFVYNQDSVKIQCNINNKIKDIFQKFAVKIGKKVDDLYILYDGNKINEELTFIETANNIDKKMNKIKAYVYDMENPNQKSINKKISKSIICPHCKENALLGFNEYKLILSSCKNKHTTENILLSQFQKTQEIDESKIICEECKENDKSNTYENQFNRCLTCKLNICPLCTRGHKNKKHNIIDYEEKNNICDLHSELYNSYCHNCQKDICVMCEKEHNIHCLVYYGSMMPDINKLKEKMKDWRDKIEAFKNSINEIIEKLNFIMENLDIVYKINDDIINNFEAKNRNYLTLQNVNDINDNIQRFIGDINNIESIDNIGEKFLTILFLYDKMTLEEEQIFKNDEEVEDKKQEFKKVENENKKEEETKEDEQKKEKEEEEKEEKKEKTKKEEIIDEIKEEKKDEIKEEKKDEIKEEIKEEKKDELKEEENEGKKDEMKEEKKEDVKDKERKKKKEKKIMDLMEDIGSKNEEEKDEENNLLEIKELKENKYDNFKLFYIEKIKDYKIDKEYSIIKVLEDGRILLYYNMDYKIEEKEYYLNGFYIISLQFNQIHNIELNNNENIEDIIIIADGTLILKVGSEKINICKVKLKELDRLLHENVSFFQ